MSANEQRVGEGWQPIETAPRDGTWRLLAYRHPNNGWICAARAHPLREALSKLSGLISDDGSDPFNRCCTRIALVMLAGIAAIYLETL